MTDLIWSFSPWLVFLVASRFTSFSGAVALGFLGAIVVLARAAHEKRAHLLDWAALCYFAALAIVLAVLHPSDTDAWSRYAQFGSHAFLTVLVFGSIVVGRPFTESYARRATPKELWHTREFHEINRKISTVWGLAFLVGDVSLALAGSVDTRQILLRVIVPFGSLYFAYHVTMMQEQARTDVAQQLASVPRPAVAQRAPRTIGTEDIARSSRRATTLTEPANLGSDRDPSGE